MLLLEQNIIKKEQMDDKNAEKLDAGNKSWEYKLEAIWDNTVYTKKSESGHLPGLYYLVS